MYILQVFKDKQVQLRAKKNIQFGKMFIFIYLMAIMFLLAITQCHAQSRLQSSIQPVELVKNGDFSAGLLYWFVNNSELFSVKPFTEEKNHIKYGDPVLEFRVDARKDSGIYSGMISQSFYLPEAGKATLSFVYFDKTYRDPRIRVRIIGDKTGLTELSNWVTLDTYAFRVHNLNYDITGLSGQNITLVIELQIEHVGSWLGFTDIFCIDDVSIKYSSYTYRLNFKVLDDANNSVDSATLNFAGADYSHGNSILVAAGAYPLSAGNIPQGYIFKQWEASGDLVVESPLSSSTTVVLTGNTSITMRLQRIANITFFVSGLGSDAYGVILTVDGISYKYNDLPKSFTWDVNSSHSFSWVSSIDTATEKYYVWQSTKGLSSEQNGTIIVQPKGGSVIATYEPKIHEHALTIFVNDGAKGLQNVGVLVDDNFYKTDLDGKLKINLTRGNHTIEIISPFNLSSSMRYVFVCWGDGFNSNRRIVNVNFDIDLICQMKLQYKVEITINPSIAEKPIKESWINDGTSLNLSLPYVIDAGNEEYLLQGWLVDGEAIFKQEVQLVVNKPLNITATYAKKLTGIDKNFYVLSKSFITNFRVNEYSFRVTVSGELGKEAKIFILLPHETLKKYDSSAEKILVLVDDKPTKFSLYSVDNGIILSTDCNHSSYTVEVYLLSYTAKITVLSIFNLGLYGAEAKILWPNGEVYTITKTDSSGNVLIKLPYGNFLVEVSYWIQTQNCSLSPQEPVKQFVFLFSIYSVATSMIIFILLLSLLIILVKILRKRASLRALKIYRIKELDSFAVETAEKCKGLLSAAVLIKEFDKKYRGSHLSLEEANKILERLFKNKQAIKWVEDGVIYLAVPPIWRGNLNQSEKELLMLIIKNGKGPERSIKREELLIKSSLPQLIFDNILKTLERNGYIVYDAYSNEVKLRSYT